MAKGRHANTARFISGGWPVRWRRRCQAMKASRQAAAAASSAGACQPGPPPRSMTRPLSRQSVPAVPRPRPTQSSAASRLALAPPGAETGT